MEYKKKKAHDVSKEHEEFEKLIKEVLKIHDKLLKMGFEEIADDALEIHKNLLGTKQKKAKPDTDNQIQKLKQLKDEYIQRLIIEMETKNVSDDTLEFLIDSIAKNFDEQINALKKTSYAHAL